MRPSVVALASTAIDMRYLLPSFAAAGSGLDLRLGPDWGALDEIDAVLCWHPPHGLAARLPRLRLVHSIAAGVDHITADPTLPADVPVCRVIDPDMASGMVSYVAWAVAHRHRHFDRYLERQRQSVWEESPIVPSRLHRVGIAGMGVLGRAVGAALATLGYDVAGWSRSAKTDLPAGVLGYHGAEELMAFLGRSDTLVCLLPLTEETRGFLAADLFRALPKGAHLVNVGRGAHLVDADLIAALDENHLSAATLDAFTEEPLPGDHPFWHHPRIVVTPHIATRTAPSVVVAQLLDNLARLEAGAPLVGAIDRLRGY
ncbi:glyoxylate/hydroxypyruvate reductase A [Aliidongia dinghuensis]|uniref:Glyoxylate/hydroxypyruvate reductase A n=1 Tax=Aliidongia dinghuensis TaxID=1867774 RepID=A0A8J2Z0X5_9PROT|nr:glyoxylate/hydroxypyruvate reductase A [Aliidongia dinghuensis]GGF44422.1 glyoxylate/hydroxypyruvate reductase A [Aliidongia dinghuensis]